MSQAIVEVTADTFEAEVLKSNVPVMVKFWAAWCGPCRTLAPVVDTLAEKFAGKLKVVSVNADSAQDICATYMVRSLPTIIFFKNGIRHTLLIGAKPLAILEEEIEKVLNP